MKYLVRPADVQPYSPANHSGTRNYRLIGPETVGARRVEVILGEIERGHGAQAHLHAGIEQVCCLLEGSAHVEIGGESFDMRPGDACFFPAGMTHVFTVTSARVLVVYSPPCLERSG